jgi:hypothetical protein
LLEGRGGVLRLAAVAHEAFVRFEITPSSRFGVLFDVSFVWGHDVLLYFMRVYIGCRMPKHT